MNRFGFSARKPSTTGNNNPQQQQHLASIRKNGSTASAAGRLNANFTPLVGGAGGGLGASGTTRPSQLFGGGIVSSMPRSKLSTGKKFGFGSASRPTIASTTGRAKVGHGGAALLLGSERKSLVFGATPRHSRASYMQRQSGASTTSRRSSVSGRGKDTRQLSEPVFIRECRDKILDFLARNDYAPPLKPAALARPTLGDISRIFEFLILYFDPEFTIQSGTKTASVDVVVPRVLSQLYYPYQLKRSDLVSCSGGRQLGAVLDAMCYVIECISYSEQCSFGQLIDFEQQDQNQCAGGGGGGGEDSFESSTNICVEIVKLLIDKPVRREDDEDGDQHNAAEDEMRQKLIALSDKFYGTEAQIEQLANQLEKFEANLNDLNEQCAKLEELPKKIEECNEDNASYDRYLAEVDEKEAECGKLLRETGAELAEAKSRYAAAEGESRRAQTIVDEQKELVMRFRFSVERKTQIAAETDAIKQMISSSNEQILSMRLDATRHEAKTSSFVSELDHVIDTFFATVRSPKINQISADFAATFERDDEWIAVHRQLRRYRGFAINAVDCVESCRREIDDFGARFQQKLNDFKLKLLRQFSALKGSASVGLICAKQELQTTAEKRQQKLAESKDSLARFVETKQAEEREEATKLNDLDGQIDRKSDEVKAADRGCESIARQLETANSENERLAAWLKAKECEIKAQITENVSQFRHKLSSDNRKNRQLFSRMNEIISSDKAILAALAKK